jgi:hypothetical protein
MNLISNELKSLIDNNQSGTSANRQGNNTQQGYSGGIENLLTAYIRRRAYALIIIACVLVLLVTTSVFTDLGLNIGQALFDFFSKLLGFS